MVNIARQCDKVHLFFIHMVYKPEVLENLLKYKADKDSVIVQSVQSNDVEYGNDVEANFWQGGQVEVKAKSGNVGEVRYGGGMTNVQYR